MAVSQHLSSSCLHPFHHIPGLGGVMYYNPGDLIFFGDIQGGPVYSTYLQDFPNLWDGRRLITPKVLMMKER